MVRSTIQHFLSDVSLCHTVDPDQLCCRRRYDLHGGIRSTAGYSQLVQRGTRLVCQTIFHLLGPSRVSCLWGTVCTPLQNGILITHICILSERMGANMLTGIRPYGTLWRTHRKLWHQHFGTKTMEGYNTRIEAEARAFVARLLENDRDVCSQLKLFVSHPDDIPCGSLSPPCV